MEKTFIELAAEEMINTIKEQKNFTMENLSYLQRPSNQEYKDIKEYISSSSVQVSNGFTSWQIINMYFIAKIKEEGLDIKDERSLASVNGFTREEMLAIFYYLDNTISKEIDLQFGEGHLTIYKKIMKAI